MEEMQEEEVRKGGVSDPDNRRFRVTVRFTEAEFKVLRQRADASATGEMADYVRQVLSRKKMEMYYRNRSMDEWVAELSRLRQELNALGNNFNQIVKKINSTGGKKEFPFWLQQAEIMQQELMKKTGFIKERIAQFAEQWFARSSQEPPSAAP